MPFSTNLYNPLLLKGGIGFDIRNVSIISPDWAGAGQKAEIEWQICFSTWLPRIDPIFNEQSACL
jgi:hypothetical protein